MKQRETAKSPDGVFMTFTRDGTSVSSEEKSTEPLSCKLHLSKRQGGIIAQTRSSVNPSH